MDHRFTSIDDRRLCVNTALCTTTLIPLVSCSPECHLDLKEDIGNMNQPIFLKNKELAIPDVNKSGGDTGVLTFKQSDTFTLACPGKNNAFVDFAAKETVQAQCKRNDDIVVDGETVSGDDLTCQDLSQSWIQGTGTTCGGNGTKGEIFDIGFQVSWVFS